MIRPRTRLVACALLALAGAVAHAQSLPQLYRLAREHDPALQSARSGRDAAQARIGQARAGLLPQLALQAGVQRTHARTELPGFSGSSAYNTTNAALVASQPLYRPAAKLGLDQSRQTAAMATLAVTGAEQDLITRLAQSYFDVLAARAVLESVRAEKIATTQQLALAKRNFDLGNATIADSREAQARFDLSRASEIAAEGDLQVKQLALEQLVGRGGLQPLALAANVILPALQPASVNAWIARAEEVHPALQQRLLALDVARLETDKARSGHGPTVDLQASVNRTRSSTLFPGTGMMPLTGTNASVGVVLNLPLFAGFAVEERVRETLAQQEQAQADLEQTRQALHQAVRSAFFGVQSGLSRVQALQAAEQSSQTALAANQLGYEVGARVNIDVLNAQSQLYQTQRELTRARYDVLLGLLRLKQSSGTLSEVDLAKLTPLFSAPDDTMLRPSQ